MSKGTKWLLLASGVAFIAMAVFELNVSLVISLGAESGFWGFAWPPFVGHRYIVVSQGLRNASFGLFVASTAILVAGALWFATADMRARWMKHKSVKT